MPTRRRRSATGTLSAERYAEALLERCAAHADLNAFITLEPEQVRAAARAADQAQSSGGTIGPLHGVPLALKDNIDTADLPTSGGTPALRNHRPKRNAPIAEALLRAGALVLGKANLHELACGVTNNNGGFGPARNPWDRRLIPGGSSGGTGVAVAARLAPGGIGTDTGGSVRIPAALCGIVGFRPTTQRWSQAGIVPISSTRDTAGPMTRSVADAILLDGVVTGGPTTLQPVPLKGLRLGVPRQYYWTDLDPELAAVCEQELSRLSALGVELVEADVPNLKALDDAVSFPVALYEQVVTMKAYLRDVRDRHRLSAARRAMRQPRRARHADQPARRERGARGGVPGSAWQASPGAAGGARGLSQAARPGRDDLSDHADAGTPDRRRRDGRSERQARPDLLHLHPQHRSREQCRPAWD